MRADSNECAPRLLSAFTGAGGLDLGLEAAGFNVVACIELDQNARSTIGKNRPDWFLLEEGDICSVSEVWTPSGLNLRQGDLEILAGGPPCQPFSKAAQWSRSKTGLGDIRSDGIRSFLKLIKIFLPRVILVENVGRVRQGVS